MNSEERVREVLAAILGIDPASVGPETSPETVKNWDSLRHMRLVMALEESFGITIPDDDIVNMTSYTAAVATIQRLLEK